MDLIWEKFTEWLKELLVGGIMDNLTGLFDNVNAKVAEAAGHIGSTPQAWNANIYSMIRSLSDNVILPIAGVILAFVMTLELIQLIADRNNLHDIDTWVFFKWVFKTAAAVLIVSNTWNIVMGVFEAAQSVVNRASGLICLAKEPTGSLLASLQAMRLPKAVGIGLAVLLRFFPTIGGEYRAIRASQRFRGIGVGVVHTLAHLPSTVEYILIPLILRTIKVAEELSASMTVRGVRFSGETISYRPVRFTGRDAALCAMAVLIPTAVFLLESPMV